MKRKQLVKAICLNCKNEFWVRDDLLIEVYSALICPFCGKMKVDFPKEEQDNE